MTPTTTPPLAREPIGMDALFDLDRLPVLRTGRNGLVSSYSRHTWNDDFTPEFIRVEAAGRRSKDLVFYSWAEGERVDDLPVAAHCEAGVWRHIAVTWNLAADGKLAKRVYLDGKIAVERTVNDWRPAEHRQAFPRKSDDRLFVGSQVASCWLRGALSDVRFYDRALTVQEVAALDSGHGVGNRDLLLNLASHEAAAGAGLDQVAPATGRLAAGPGGRGLAFAVGQNLVYRAGGSLTPRSGTFAAWVNPSELAEGAMQHLFCLGADSMGLYLAPGIAGGEGVLADLNGPGCIYRVWLGGGAGRTLHFYFDGEASPRVSLRFSGQHGEPDFGTARWLPLTSSGGDLCYPPMMATGVAGAPYLETGICYMPMPFRKSCKITMTPAGTKYLQVNYSLYPAGTTVQTFDPPIREKDLAQCKAGRERWSHPAPCEPAAGVRAEDATHDVTLAPGQSSEVYRAGGSGRITGLWVKLSEALRREEVLRGLRLRVYWDGDAAPAIDAPVGPFFSDAYGTPSTTHPVPLSPDIRGAVPDAAQQEQWSFGLPAEDRNILIGYTRDRGYYCFFPMPFSAGARIELENTTSSTFSASLTVRREAGPIAQNMGRFHAVYHRENPTLGIDDPTQVRVDFTGARNFVILDCAGRGHFVGCSLFLRQTRNLKPEVERLVGAICEGNEMIFVDDDPTLTMIGTGSEDYLNQNYWVHDHIYPYDGNRNGYDTCYRFHVSDCVAFRKHIRATIEHGAANAHYIDYSSVAYWYQEAKSAR